MNQPTNKPKGIFDEGAKDNTRRDPLPKDTFKDPFAKQADDITKRAQQQGPKLDDILNGDKVLENTASAVNSGGDVKNVQADLDEMGKIDPKDLDLAEQMIFKGYAEDDVEMVNFPNHKFTICSTSAEEIAIVEEIIFDVLKGSERDDGSVNLPQAKVTGLRNGLFVAISYRGMDENELSNDSKCHLNTIKTAVIRANDLENSGSIDEADKLKESLKKRLLQRTALVNRMATPVIDFLSESKYLFDTKMNRILSSKEIIPKS